MQKVHRANLRTAGAHWYNLEPFEGSNFRGYPTDHPRFPSGTGYMPADERAEYLNNAPRWGVNSDIVYVVFSYATPVAWVYSDGRRYVTDHKYSMSTSCQISRAGLRVPIGDPDTARYWAWRTGADA